MRLTQLVKYSYATYQQFKAEFNFSKNKELRKMVSTNAQFKNIHKKPEGSRCFILGNGPSLNDEDLSLLKNEYVFTVNKLGKHPQFKDLNTNYHFWADPIFFKSLSSENEGDNDLIEAFLSINTPDNKPVCFMPYYAKKTVTDFNLEEKLNIRYYCATLPFRDNEKKEIDFTKATFGFDTVVQWAISMAIYMGFSEIYLLGCDMTFIMGIIQTKLNEENNYYAYKVNNAEKQFAKNNIINNSGVEAQFISCAKMLHLYSELKKYCDQRGIKLVNLSSKTIIESLPKQRLSEILNKGEYTE